MRTFSSEDLKRFLRSVDKHLTSPVSILVIGGSAASLGYGIKTSTKDIDLFETEEQDYKLFQEACERAKQETNLEIPVEEVGVGDVPYNYEDRLQKESSLGLNWLEVRYPEKHDLALMKIIRGYEHDIQHVKEIHQNHTLDLRTLTNRFINEMSHVVGIGAEQLQNKFLLMIEEVFGEEEADEAERAIAQK
jgi:hypothetical protein